jgi:predicted dehydrogenase
MAGTILRAAVIGVRHPHIGEFADAAKATQGVRLVAVAEDLEHLRTPAAEKWGVAPYADFRELLDRERPEVVGLATTNAQKAAVAAECLERGIHVIADKPLTTDAAGLSRLRAAVALGRGRLSLMLTCRFGRGYRAIHRLIQEGRLGRVVHMAAFGPHRLRPATRGPWMLDDQESGGIIVDLGIHYLDLMRWYTGEEPERVVATHGNLRFPEFPRFTDHGHVLLTFPGGGAGYVSVDWLTPEASPVHGDYRVFVTGTRGTCELKSGGGATLTLVTDTDPPHEVPLDDGAREVTPSRDFLEALRDGRSPRLDVEDVFQSTEVSLRAREVAQQAETPRM